MLTRSGDNIKMDLDTGFTTSSSPRATDNGSYQYTHKRPSMGENQYSLLRKKGGWTITRVS